MPVERVYSFTASAVGFALRIRRPNKTNGESHAASALSHIGGVSKGRATQCRLLRGKIGFVTAATECSGDFVSPEKAVQFTKGNHGQNDLATRTSVKTTVTGLYVTNSGPDSSRTVTLKRTEVGIVAVNPRKAGNQPEFDLETVKIDGLAIDGAKVRVRLATPVFRKHKTQDALKTAFEGDPDFFEAASHLFYSVSDQRARRFPQGSTGHTRATVVDRIEWENPKRTPPPGVEFLQPNAIRIDGWGTLYLGEITISPYARGISMFRAALGSPDGGELEMGSGDINGHEVP